MVHQNQSVAMVQAKFFSVVFPSKYLKIYSEYSLKEGIFS